MRRFLTAALVLTLATAAHAAELPKAVEHDLIVHDFQFASGERMAEVRLHYATIGTLRRSESGATNAVLLLHGTGGSLRQFLNDHFAGVLFTPGGLLDASRFFIVIPDNIGHGGSSKPSDGMHAHFPHYAYADMIALQHRIVTEGLGIRHLYLVMGTSMGGMQTWMWGERYPGMMDGLVPLASVPTAIAGRNRVWRKMIVDLIRSDPSWNGGEYSAQPKSLAAALDILMLATSSPLQWQKSMPTASAADAWLSQQQAARLASTDANDLLYALEASRDYAPESQLGEIRAPLLAINSADDFVNPPELHLLESLMPRVKRGRSVVLPITDATRGHGTHTWPAVWQSYLADFLHTLPPAP